MESGDPAALVLRIGRLEDELRTANGAIEELQNQQQRLQEQLKRFQEDVEFRFNGASGPRPVSANPAPAPAIAAAPGAPLESAAIKPAKRSDAFDPSVEPGAVGAPKPLGTTSPSAPLDLPGPTAGAPLDLAHPGPTNAPPTGPLSADAQGAAVIPCKGGAAIDGP